MISRVFHKSAGGKKIPISGLIKMNNGNYYHDDFESANLPPLMEMSSGEGGSRTEISHVTCFSESVEEQKQENDEMVGSWSSSSYPMAPNMENFQYQDTTWMQDPSILKILHDPISDSNVRQNPKIEMVDNQDYGMNFGGQADFDCLWNY